MSGKVARRLGSSGWTLAWALAALALPAVAQTAGFLAGPGTTGAFVGGQPLLPGTLVTSGETVKTGPNGMVVLAQTGNQGGLVQLGGNGQALVSGSTVSSAPAMSITQGSAIVSGTLSVSTSQAVFQPTGLTNEYVVNAAGNQSRMAVLNGNVNTITPNDAPPQPVHAGAAVTVNDQSQVNNVAFNSVSKPSANTAVTNPVAASTSH